MERRVTRWRAALAALAALGTVLAGCGGAGGASPTPEADGGDAGWMDGALVQVVNDGAAGRQRVTLHDPATGNTAVVDDGPLTPGAVEFEDE
jgi:hypothetical protein